MYQVLYYLIKSYISKSETRDRRRSECTALRFSETRNSIRLCYTALSNDMRWPTKQSEVTSNVQLADVPRNLERTADHRPIGYQADTAALIGLACSLLLQLMLRSVSSTTARQTHRLIHLDVYCMLRSRNVEFADAYLQHLRTLVDELSVLFNYGQ